MCFFFSESFDSRRNFRHKSFIQWMKARSGKPKRAFNIDKN